MIINCLLYLFDNIFHLFIGCGIRKRNIEIRTSLMTFRLVFQFRINHFFIRHGYKTFISRAEARAAETYRLHLSGNGTDMYHITDYKWLVKKYGERSNQIFNGFFWSERYGKSANTESRNESGYVYVKDSAHNKKHAHNSGNQLEQITDKGNQLVI